MSAETKKTVLILTGHYRIVADISIIAGSRVTDFLAESRDFIGLTNAEVLDHNGRMVAVTKFMNLQKNVIEIVIPMEEATKAWGRLKSENEIPPA